MSKKALFLDRDGTLIIDTDYPNDPGRVEFVPGTPEALRKVQKEYELIVISNQSGVGRGLITPEQFDSVHQQFMNMLKQEKVELRGVHYCVHSPEENCECRKPNPKMILDAANEYNIDLSASYMIGDKLSDMAAGSRAGCQTILITSESRGDYIGLTASDLNQAVRHIITGRG